MEGLVLDLASLKRELQERKASHSLQSSVSPLRLVAARQSLYRPYDIPASRQELVTQYTKNPVQLRRPAKLQGYKRDAAALLVELLEKHFAKRWIAWKTQANSTIPAKKPSNPYNEGGYRKAKEGFSPLSGDYPRWRMEKKAEKASEIALEMGKNPALSADLYGDVMLERLAMVSDRPSVPSPSPYLSAQRLIIALRAVLNRSRKDAISNIRLWGIKKKAGKQLALLLFSKLKSAYKEAICLISEGKAQEIRLFELVMMRIKLRPYWEQLKLVALRGIMAQVVALGMEKLGWVHKAVVKQAFHQLQTAPSVPPSPPIALKSVLQGLYMRRLQASFSNTKRYSEYQQVHTANLSSKLAISLQIFTLFRVKTLSKYLNRLRPSGFSQQNRPKSAFIGLLLVAQAFKQAQTRSIRLTFTRLAAFSDFQRKQSNRMLAATHLFTYIHKIQLKDCLFPLQTLRKSLGYADLMRNGKKVVKRMIAVYLKDIRSKLGNSFAAWQRAAIIKETGLEGQRINGILRGLIRRRLDWSFGNLKPEIDVSRMEKGEIRGKAVAAVMRLMLIRAFRPIMRTAWVVLAEKITLSAVNNAENVRKSKEIATKLILNCTKTAILHSFQSCIYRFKRILAFSRLNKVLFKRSMRLWKGFHLQIRQFQRGIELISITIRRKLASFLHEMQSLDYFNCQDTAFIGQNIDLSPSQSLRLKLGLNRLQMHHCLVRKSALLRWKTAWIALRLAARQHRLSAATSIALSLHSLLVSQQQDSFKRLLYH